MDITGKTVLVTGANRGLGRQLAAQLRDRGARVYAAARGPQAADLAGVTPIAWTSPTRPRSPRRRRPPATWRSWSTTRAHQPDPRY
jgi:NAD(P)-dependent dehydrogenase (short-subunit alcohol dehydrogenase family)